MTTWIPTPSARSRFTNEGTYTPQGAGDTCFICECVCDAGEFGPCRCGCSECGCDDLHVMYPEEG